MATPWITTMKVLSDFTLKLSTRFPMARWSPLPLRLIVGYGFMEHGFAKLSKGPDAFAAILQGMGVPDPYVMAWCTILIELLGGLAVILGAFVTIVSVPMAVVLLVAMFKVHLPYGFSSVKLLAVTATGATFGPPGYEVNLLYSACLAALVIGGSGPFAIDGLIGKRFDARTRTSRIPPSVLQKRRFLTCRECGWVHYVMPTAEKAAHDRRLERYQLSATERSLYESVSRRRPRYQSPASAFAAAPTRHLARAAGHTETPVFVDGELGTNEDRALVDCRRGASQDCR